VQPTFPRAEPILIVAFQRGRRIRAWLSNIRSQCNNNKWTKTVLFMLNLTGHYPIKSNRNDLGTSIECIRIKYACIAWVHFYFYSKSLPGLLSVSSVCDIKGSVNYQTALRGTTHERNTRNTLTYY
ncbi:unnamed protein product, partial [Nesidiocoris tenuis]